MTMATPSLSVLLENRPPRVDDERHEDEVTLRAFVAASSQRMLHTRLVLLLTLAAGWTDALSYLYLDKVFSSFMSGNILFVGLALAQGNGAVLVRAILAVLIFFCGITLGSLYLGRGSQAEPGEGSRKAITGYLLIEVLVLLAFAILWQLTGTPANHPVTQVALLGMAAFAMGLQGALIATFNLPDILSVALTAVVVLLGMRIAHGIGRQTTDQPGRTSSPFLVVLLISYTLAALVAALLISSPFIPCIIVTAAVLTVLVAPEREENRPVLARKDAAHV
jgi:uncharacterized membrane protein YoaK (UPF0700 family)